MWFCNRRQKEKRMLSGALNAAGGLLMSDPGSAASSEVHDDCSPTSRSSSGDDLVDDTRNGPSTVYNPAHSCIDYCNSLSTPRRDYCSADSSPFQSSSTHAPPEVGLSSYACAVSGWPTHLRSPQLASLVAAAAGAMLPDNHAASSIAM